MYITNVITDAAAAGIQTEISFGLFNVNDPANIPAVTPRRMKNTAIRDADRADTSMLPSLQNALKQARMQSERNIKADIDCRIRDLRRDLF